MVEEEEIVLVLYVVCTEPLYVFVIFDAFWI